jgi:type IV pilus assembly protein PilQ
MIKEKRSKIMYCEKVTKNKKNICRSLFLWGFVLITLIVTTAAGANAPAAVNALAGTNVAASKTPQIIDKFDVEEDFDVRKALAMLGSLCDKNIVPSPNVNGSLAFRSLKNVTFEEAMDAILGENFKYEQDGKLIKVYTKDEYIKMKEDPARMTHEVFTLYYITAKEAHNLITPVLSKSAQVQVTTEAEKDVSGGGSGTGITASASTKGGGDDMALNDMIVVYDYPENLEKVAEVLKSVDIRPKQVLIEATILSARLTEETKFGIDWNFFAGVSLIGTSATSDLTSATEISRGTSATKPIGQIAAGGAGTPIETAGFATPGMNGLRVGATSGSMAMFLTALEEITDVTILANPKVLAVNKQEGFVQIGQKLGYVNQTSQNLTSTTQSVAFLETGTVLQFRPYIGDDGYIRMDILPKDSSGVVANSLPQETLTMVKSNIMVKDGETIVIGGLFRDSVTTGRTQVPLLGDIPFVGALFRGTTDTTERQEVIVLLTPHIIKEPSQLDGKARAEDISRKRYGAEKELQWIDRARLAEDNYADAVKLYMEGDNEAAMKKLQAALMLRPTYLEAIRLKEKILAEVDPEKAQKLQRIIQDTMEYKDAPNWQRK